RTLESLERQGIVQHAHLGHGPAVYHVVADDHLHLVCESCHAVIEVPARRYAGLARSLARNYGFEIDVHHFAVLGSCAACRTAPAAGAWTFAPTARSRAACATATCRG